MMKQQIRILTKLSEIQELKNSWDALITSSSLPFYTFEWFQSLLEIYPKNRSEMAVFVLEQNDEITAILPCHSNPRNQSLSLLTDQYGVRADIITKDRQAAACLLKYTLRYAHDENICVRFGHVTNDSYIYHCFSSHTRSSLLHEPVSKQLSLSLDEIERPQLDDEKKYRFLAFEGRQVSRNLLLEIEQFYNRSKSKSINHFKAEEFIPFINKLRYQDTVGLTVHTIRDENRDLLSVELGFRRGRNYYSLFYLGSKKRTYTQRHLRQQVPYLEKKGVRQILSDKQNPLLINCKESAPTVMHRCVAYGPNRIQQCQFQLNRQKLERTAQLHHLLNLLKIRTKLICNNSCKKLKQSRITAQEFLKESNSRIKERRSSST